MAKKRKPQLLVVTDEAGQHVYIKGTSRGANLRGRKIWVNEPGNKAELAAAIRVAMQEHGITTRKIERMKGE